jgi:hypothetical protein
MTAETESGSDRRRWWLYIIASLLILFALYYSVMAILSSSQKISAINEEFGFKRDEKNPLDIRIFSDSAYVKLNREKAFYQSRNIMAETDSICLALNLSDSTATLEINGVAVHSAKLLNIQAPKILYKCEEYAISSMLSVPFSVIENFSTIMKEPLMLKIAPRDTSEYKPDILPDTTNSAAVNYIMGLDHGFRLYVYQDTGDDAGGALNRLIFDMGDRFKNIWANMKSIAVFKVPEYHPSIRLKLKKADARIIYRALPVNGQIALYR